MSMKVTLYAELESEASVTTKAAMDSAGIQYELVPVTIEDCPLQAVDVSYKGAPVTVAGGASWDGYRPDLIARLAAEQALDGYEVPVDPMDELHCESCQ